MACCYLQAAGQNEKNLVEEVATVCATGNHDNSDLYLLRQGAIVFGVPQLNELADMLENHVLDVQNHQSISALESLLNYTEHTYGKESREVVACRRMIVARYLPVNWQKSHDLAVENARCSGVLSARSPKDKSLKLLDIVVRLELLSIEKVHDGDNPNHWAQLYRIEQELEPYFKGKVVYTPELVDACQYMANLQTYTTIYLVYVGEIMHECFPNGHYLEGRLYGNDLFSNMEAFMNHAIEGAKMLWGEQDLRTLFVECDLLAMQMRYQLADYSTIHDRLKEIHAYMRSYLPQGSLDVDRVEMLIWECNLLFGEQLYEIRSAYPIQSRVRTCFGEESETYLNITCQLTTMMMMVDPNKGGPLLEEAEQLVEKQCHPGTDLYDVYMVYLVTAKQSLSHDNPQAYQSYLEKCTDYYQRYHRATWESVYAGRMLASVFSSSLLLPDKAADIERTVLKDLKALVDEETIIYTSCMEELVALLGSSDNQESLQEAVAYCQKILEINERLGASLGQTSLSLSHLQIGIGKNDAAIETLRTGIKKCVKPEDGMWRCMMQLQLGWELSNRGLNFNEESRQLFEDAIPFFNSNIENAAGGYMDGFLLIGNYYSALNQFDKAEETLTRGMALHESLYGEYDYTYTHMIDALYDIYANGQNDMDKAEQLLEGRVEAMRQNPSFSKNYALMQLLWKRYYLLTEKSNDWMLRMTALNEITAQFNYMLSLTGQDDSDILKSLAIKLVSECSRIYSYWGKVMKEAQQKIDSHSDELTPKQMEAVLRIDALIQEQARNEFGPLLKEIEQQMKAENPSRSDSPEALDIYNALSNYYLAIEKDTIKAESYYQELMNSQNILVRFLTLIELAGLKMDQGQYEEAVSLYEQQGQMAQQLPVSMLSMQDRAFFFSMLTNAYFRSRHYQDAIAPARQLFSLRQQLAAQNFDLLTQTERERFIEDGGVGGNGIVALVSKFPKELSKDCYDVMLASRGLLLRASERVKKAILQSGDHELIAMMDSLNQLTAHYKTMNHQTDWEHGHYEYDPETVKLRQQIEALERSINRQASRFIEGMNTPNWQKLQSVLKPDEAAIEYMFSDSVLCCALVLLPQGEPQFVSLTSGNKLWEELEALKRLNPLHKAEVLYQEDRLALYDKLWKPIERLLQGVKTIYFSPTGFLNDLAYAAFKCEDGGYLSERYELHQMLSTGDLVALREQTDSKSVTSASLYGAVFYSPEQESLANSISKGTAHRGMAQDGRGAIQDDDEAFGYLSFTKQEIADVCRIFNDHQVTAARKSGFEPTEQALRCISGCSPQVLHLSTHGFFIKGDASATENKFLARFPSTRGSSMQRSGLALVDANRAWEGATDKPEEADGILTANEVALLDLSQTRLAVLSACQTAVGEYSIEGVYGMHRGFKQAGVRSILGSLWNVNDKSTARLMELFYQKWLSGTTMQKSLNEAIRELRKEYPSPFYWAPFVLLDAEN